MPWRSRTRLAEKNNDIVVGKLFVCSISGEQSVDNAWEAASVVALGFIDG